MKREEAFKTVAIVVADVFTSSGAPSNSLTER